jgi:beta-galactosidase
LALTLPGAHTTPVANAVAWCDVLAPSGAEVLGTYTEDYYAGLPAVTRNRAGRGQAVYVGTFGDAALYDTLADWLIAEAGVTEGVASPAGVEVCTRWHAGHRLVFVLNHTRAAQQVTLPGHYSLLVGAAAPA